ncbi:hypothetical protein AALO_G00166950 [Alosa alosa]|uniref:Uncharacterized protein n=1 Tax=Alosa alosa TaxID=278164 RepID=A0AAV6GBR6_9TELE|nr:germ cell nuclear acidic protein-like [Alosa alosa]KAG5272569.1 hypothetical protein AALO_G00166950 [Alosa alosa]
MPKRQAKTKHVEPEDIDDLEDIDEGAESSFSECDSEEEHNFLAGKDPDFELDSNEDWVPPSKTSRAEDPVSEEEEPVAETSGTQRGKGAARSRGRGRGRGRGQGRGRGRGRGRSHSRQESGGTEPWHGTDIQDTIPPQPTFRPMRTPGPQLISTQYSILQLFQLFITRSILLTVVANIQQ